MGIMVPPPADTKPLPAPYYADAGITLLDGGVA